MRRKEGLNAGRVRLGSKTKKIWDAYAATRYYQWTRWAIRIAQVVVTLHRLFDHHG